MEGCGGVKGGVGTTGERPNLGNGSLLLGRRMRDERSRARCCAPTYYLLCWRHWIQHELAYVSIVVQVASSCDLGTQTRDLAG